MDQFDTWLYWGGSQPVICKSSKHSLRGYFTEIRCDELHAYMGGRGGGKGGGLADFLSRALSSVYILSASRHTSTWSRRPDTLTNLPQIRHFSSTSS